MLLLSDGSSHILVASACVEAITVDATEEIVDDCTPNSDDYRRQRRGATRWGEKFYFMREQRQLPETANDRRRNCGGVRCLQGCRRA